jgi:nucleotide-binding universal stress UspA family protein
MTAKHILVPTDFSEYADHALDYAITLAQKLRARLTLLHIIQLTPMTMGDMYGYSLEADLEAMESEAQRQMQALLNRVHQEGLESETAIVQGVPFQMIVDMAESQDIDLIVMGTHGRAGLTHALMGSVAEKVVRMAPCPVLVTRGTTETSDA